MWIVNSENPEGLGVNLTQILIPTLERKEDPI
jgi:hypothetical protein